MLGSGHRFIDWELLTNAEGERTCAFGWMAGFAGMVNALSLVGVKLLLAKNLATPFLEIPRPFTLGSTERVGEVLKRVGREIKEKGLGGEGKPICVTVLGRGRVAKGAWEVLDTLGVEWVKVQELKSLFKTGECLHHLVLREK
jgi:alpha-aminoadipic semialdehyde synthase